MKKDYEDEIEVNKVECQTITAKYKINIVIML